MYKTHIKQWGLDKKHKEQDMRAIVHKTQQLRSRGQTVTFRVRGRLVEYNDVVRYWERKGVSVDDVVAQRANSKTPEAVKCFTSPSSPSSPLVTPRSMATLERILVAIRDYYTGSFETGTWFTEDPQTSCQTKKSQRSVLDSLNSLGQECSTACTLFAEDHCEEAGQILISATSNIEMILLSEHPETLSMLFEIVSLLLYNKRDGVALSILRQFSALAKIVLGEGHPLYIICRWLTSIRAADFKYIITKCWASLSDHLERLIGPLHISTLICRGLLYNTLEQEQSHTMSLQELREKCEATLGSLNARTMIISLYLALSYLADQDYVKAIDLGWEIITKTQPLDEVESAQSSMWPAELHADGLSIVAKSERALGEMHRSEIHLREAIDSRISMRGPHDAQVIKWLVRLERWLVEQGQLEAAAEVQQRWKESLPEVLD